MLMAKISTVMINKYGDMGHPCLIPHWGLNHSEISPLLMTAEEIFLYIVLIKDRNVSPKLNASRVLSIKFQLIESKAFSKSIFNIILGRLCVLANSHLYLL